MDKYASKYGSKLTKTASGYKFSISKEEWLKIGTASGWLDKSALFIDSFPPDEEGKQYWEKDYMNKMKQKKQKNKNDEKNKNDKK